MERVWLKSYSPGVPADIDWGGLSSLRDVLEASFSRFGDQVAYTCMGADLTFAELDRQSAAFGSWLQHGLRLPKGSRVAIMLPNVLQYPVAVIGVLRAGYVGVNCNPLYTPRELEHQLADSGAEAIVVLENFAHTLEQVIGRTAVKAVVTTRVGDMLRFPKSAIVNFVVKRVKKAVPAFHLPGALTLDEALSRGAQVPLERPPLSLDDLAFLQYTGGTTGVSKGAMLTHGNLLSNLLQVSYWVGDQIEEGREVIITALPLYHIFALTANCLAFMKFGAKNVLIPNPRDIPGFVKELSRHRFSVITGVNTLFNALNHSPDFARLDFSSLKLTLGGGMAVQRAVARRWKEITGNPILEAYGLTETSPGACINPLRPGADFNGTVGLPLPSTVVTIRDDAGSVLPIGEIGEICIAGPQVMQGYWNRPDETAKVLLADGALRTGDIGTLDADGYVRIVDRKKDMILVSGFNVYPNEIEDVVASMPGVLEVCAVSMPDEGSGEAVRVVVVPRDASLTVGAIQAHCRANLTNYKVPKVIELWKSLPKTNVGKVLRREVKNTPVPR